MGMNYNHFNMGNMGNRNFGGFNYGNRSYPNFNRSYNLNAGYGTRRSFTTAGAFGGNIYRSAGFNNLNAAYGNRVNYNNVGFNNANIVGSRWGSPYAGYHRGWVNGYWNGNGLGWGWNNGNWGWQGALGFGLGYGLGYGLGWGLPAWGYGSSYYSNWGYSNYSNPYYDASAVVIDTPIVVNNPVPAFNYSQPIDTSAPAPAESVASNANGVFDAARVAFKEGDYAKALKQVDQALAITPNDTAMHEFRGVVLFATKQYDKSAASLYSVLAVGPGWDWTTLIGLYPNVDVYTEQLRAAEAYSDAHPDWPPVRFVLAYNYLTAGYNDAAINELKEVVKLKPSDQISTQLLSQLSKKPDPQTPSQTAQADTTATPLPEGATLKGIWTARPNPGTTIKLTVQPDDKFTWQVDQKGQTHELAGESTFGGSILTLAQSKGPALVGHVSWKDANHMTFRVVGGGTEDPGLSFSK